MSSFGGFTSYSPPSEFKTGVTAFAEVDKAQTAAENAADGVSNFNETATAANDFMMVDRNGEWGGRTPGIGLLANVAIVEPTADGEVLGLVTQTQVQSAGLSTLMNQTLTPHFYAHEIIPTYTGIVDRIVFGGVSASLALDAFVTLSTEATNAPITNKGRRTLLVDNEGGVGAFLSVPTGAEAEENG